MAKKKFVDNAKFLILLKEYQETKIICNGLGKIFTDMANHLAYSRQFINYSEHWKNEMKSDAIFNCCRYLGNFKTEERDNPFAYFTTVMIHAFIARINKEKLANYRLDNIKDRIFTDFMIKYNIYSTDSSTNPSDSNGE